MLKRMLMCKTVLYFVKSDTPLSLVLGGIRTDNLLIFGLTTKLSCLGARQEDSGLPKPLIQRVRWIVSIAQALRMIDAQANFYIVKSETPLSLVLGGIRTHNIFSQAKIQAHK